jgi:hypothetical protein
MNKNNEIKEIQLSSNQQYHIIIIQELYRISLLKLKLAIFAIVALFILILVRCSISLWFIINYKYYPPTVCSYATISLFILSIFPVSKLSKYIFSNDKDPDPNKYMTHFLDIIARRVEDNNTPPNNDFIKDNRNLEDEEASVIDYNSSDSITDNDIQKMNGRTFKDNNRHGKKPEP